MTVFRALILSLIVHMLIMLGVGHLPEVWVWDQATPEIAEIEFIEAPSRPADSPQIVRDVTPPENVIDDNNEEARFLSAQRRRVLLETQSRESGLTQNSPLKPLPHDSWLRKFAQNNEAGNPQERQNESSPDGFRPIPLPSPGQMRQAFEGAPSTTGERLPDDVSLGEFTALNTDRFKYYSFYARIEELVRFRWEQGLRRAIETFPMNQVASLSRDRWTTQVEFWLTSEGRFHSAHIHRESGLRRFDVAAVNAFREAAVFPNPPAELVEEDGMIRVQYSFTVRWSPTWLVNR